ncbi:MAG TPA: tetratricopeptide repeat protein [Kofleriaceae bacterium]|jgi:tetratricopeptide (TPR) repeat protein|nr:tetratricopeptide repeat protein [Kofleriaceae bacterium]
MRKISFAVVLIPALAWAGPKTADQWYDEGANQFTLGNFDKAIDAFKQGFTAETDESKKANYLYNIAQVYRQAHDCNNALFFYKRYLAAKANDTVKPIPSERKRQVEGFITEADACVKQQTRLSEKPPVNNVRPDGDDRSEKTDPGDKGDKDRGDKAHPVADTGHKETRPDVATAQKPADADGDDEDTGVTKKVASGQPRVISVRVIGGGSKVNAGSISVPVQATFGAVGGYPIPINPQLTIEAGAAFTFTPAPYQDDVMKVNKTGQLWGLMANAAATYEVIPNLGVRADLGLGALLFADISESPFTAKQVATGALTMFHTRVALSADYAVTPNLVLTAMPGAFTYSPAASGIAGGGSIISYDFMVGIGYRR